MRVLALSLLLANLLFLAWQYWIKDEPVPPADPYRGLPALQLAARTAGDPPVTPAQAKTDAEAVVEPADPSGVPQDADAAEPSAAGSTAVDPGTPEVAAPAPLVCVSLGPFPAQADADAASASLAGQGFGVSQRSSEGEIWQGYWVYLPPFPDRVAARRALALLESKGISDAYIIPGGEDQHAISLGLFSERQRAERRQQQIAAKGVRPGIADSRRTGTVHWLDVTVPDPALVDPLAFRSVSDQILRLRTTPCPGSE